MSHKLLALNMHFCGPSHDWNAIIDRYNGYHLYTTHTVCLREIGITEKVSSHRINYQNKTAQNAAWHYKPYSTKYSLLNYRPS